MALERSFWADGDRVVVGVDEVGKGAWAGPLSVGAAVLPPDRRVNGIRDSKLLSETERERLFPRIAQWCVTWAVGHASNAECDALGMTDAQRLATRRALAGLGVRPDRILQDGRIDFVGGGRTTTIVKGDQSCLSIAAASILAKVTRDRIMRQVAPECAAFAFDRNKGYPSVVHRQALHAQGPTRWHRRSWAFMDALEGHERFRRGDRPLPLEF